MAQPTAAEIRALLARDHSLLEAPKSAYWTERKRSRGVADAIRVADELRRQAQALRPDWPSDEERAADLACHQPVAEILARAEERPR